MMGADQVAEITPAIREVLDGGVPWFAHIEVTGQSDLWFEFACGEFSAAYPLEGSPTTILDSLGSCSDVEWKPLTYVTGNLELVDPRDIAHWIDSYLSHFLEPNADYSVDWELHKGLTSS